MEIRISEGFITEFKNNGLTIAQMRSIADRIAIEVEDIPPKYKIDSADNISVDGIELSWIRDNKNRTLDIITRREAKTLDSYKLA